MAIIKIGQLTNNNIKLLNYRIDFTKLDQIINEQNNNSIIGVNFTLVPTLFENLNKIFLTVELPDGLTSIKHPIITCPTKCTLDGNDLGKETIISKEAHAMNTFKLSDIQDSIGANKSHLVSIEIIPNSNVLGFMRLPDNGGQIDFQDPELEIVVPN